MCATNQMYVRKIQIFIYFMIQMRDFLTRYECVSNGGTVDSVQC